VINPQVAARLARNFERWKRFEPKRQALMKKVLARKIHQGENFAATVA